MKFFSSLLKVIFLYILFSLNLFANQILTICGTGDNQALLRNLGKIYEAENPGIKINIPDSIGSSGGIKHTAQGKCNLGRIARNIKKEEKKYNLNYILFSYSPVVFVTNKNLKNLKNLNETTIKEIFSGEKKIWESYDKGNRKKIYIVKREPSDSSFNVLKNNIPLYKNIKKYAGKVVFSTPEAVKILENYENTIGYLPYSATLNTDLNILNYNNIEPNEENILNHSYKLVLPYGFVYKGVLDELSKNFINFMKTNRARLIIRENGALPSL